MERVTDEVEIVEDLRDAYSRAASFKELHHPFFRCSEVRFLIERISRLEAENKRLNGELFAYRGTGALHALKIANGLKPGPLFEEAIAKLEAIEQP